jgi:hypothetical protein
MGFATVNVPGVALGPKEAVIKNYSENQGILPELIKAGVTSQPKRIVAVGYADGPVVDVLV